MMPSGGKQKTAPKKGETVTGSLGIGKSSGNEKEDLQKMKSLLTSFAKTLEGEAGAEDLVEIQEFYKGNEGGIPETQKIVNPLTGEEIHMADPVHEGDDKVLNLDKEEALEEENAAVAESLRAAKKEAEAAEKDKLTAEDWDLWTKELQRAEELADSDDEDPYVPTPEYFFKKLRKEREEKQRIAEERKILEKKNEEKMQNYAQEKNAQEKRDKLEWNIEGVNADDGTVGSAAHVSSGISPFSIPKKKAIGSRAVDDDDGGEVVLSKTVKRPVEGKAKVEVEDKSVFKGPLKVRKRDDTTDGDFDLDDDDMHKNDLREVRSAYQAQVQKRVSENGVISAEEMPKITDYISYSDLLRRDPKTGNFTWDMSSSDEEVEGIDYTLIPRPIPGSMLDDYYKSLPESYKEAIAYLESQENPSSKKEEKEEDEVPEPKIEKNKVPVQVPVPDDIVVDGEEAMVMSLSTQAEGSDETVEYKVKVRKGENGIEVSGLLGSKPLTSTASKKEQPPAEPLQHVKIGGIQVKKKGSQPQSESIKDNEEAPKKVSKFKSQIR